VLGVLGGCRNITDLVPSVIAENDAVVDEFS